MDFAVKSREFVAITGPSGQGKTTLLKLLLGLHRPTSGTIELDGHRADPELWRAWRTRVGVVAQDDRLLSGTIADNIAFFDPDIDMARVQAAAKAAQVHDDIMRAPMQYLGLVGDMGSTLSGGQRQRVLLARALYGEPRVLFLDEGTANLDGETEEAIVRLIEAMPITRIIVAHRPALIRRAQRVFIVKDRHIAEVDANAVVPSDAAARTDALPPISAMASHAAPAPAVTAPPLAPELGQTSAAAPIRPPAREPVSEPALAALQPRRRAGAWWAAAAVVILCAGAATIWAWRGFNEPPPVLANITEGLKTLQAPPRATVRENEPAEPVQAASKPAPDQPASKPSFDPAASKPAPAHAATAEPTLAVPARVERAPAAAPNAATTIQTPPAPVLAEPARPERLAALPPPRSVKGARAVNARESFRDCAKCPELIMLPEGSFEMGSKDEPTQGPVHRVTVAPFALGRFPVTVGEWRQCVEALACTYQPLGDNDLPVSNLSWNDTQQYIGWLSRISQRQYRLPTEAEWEYAARAQTKTRYWWGNEPTSAKANCKGCGEPYDARHPIAVGSFESNPFGLYDMGGGVWQWVSDCWHADYRGAPGDAGSWATPSCVERVLRGGSWMNDPSYLRTTTRHRYEADVRYPANGFRVARPN